MNNIVTDKGVGERIKEYVLECIGKGERPTIRKIGEQVRISSTSHVWYWLQRLNINLGPIPKRHKEPKAYKKPKPPKVYKYKQFPTPAIGHKYCRCCYQEKPLECFTTDNAHKDKKHPYCHKCSNDKLRDSYRRNPQPFKDTTKRWIKNNPEKVRAHSRLNEAVRRGRITKPEYCEICEQTKRIEAHHWKGYSDEYVLDVQWLCRACHRKQDTKSKLEQAG